MHITIRHTSNTDLVIARMRAATGAGLRAAADVYRNAILRDLKGGYTSSLGNHGNFVTGLSTSNVFASELRITDDGLMVRVYTPLLYNLYWELGHHNIFTRHFERDEKWSIAFYLSKPDALSAFARTYKRAMAV